MKTKIGMLAILAALAAFSACAATDLGEIALSDDIPPVVYRLVSGTNAVFVITNYNSQVHCPSIRFEQLGTNGTWTTYYDSRREHAETLTNAMDYADAVAATRAPAAWSRTTSGLGQEAPDGVTWVSTPQTTIAGGYEYEKVLTSSGFSLQTDSASRPTR